MMTTAKSRQILLLALVLLLATMGRISGIDDESLWVDEGFSYWAIQHPDLLGVVARDVHPPLYFLMLDFWSGLTGISELALRYLSVIPGVLSVAMVYQLARELTAFIDAPDSIRQSAPLLVALMLALADMENYIAQEARMYTWHVLWATVSMWAFVRWMRLHQPLPVPPRSQAESLFDRTETRSQPVSHSPILSNLPLTPQSERGPGSQRVLVVWFLASLLLMYTHYIGVAALAAQGLVALLFLRGRMRVLALGTLAAVGVLFLPWVAVMVGQTANVGTGFNVPSTLESLWNWRIEWFTGQWALMMGLAVVGIGVLMTSNERFDSPAHSFPAMEGNIHFGDFSLMGADTNANFDGVKAYAAPFLLLLWIILPVAGAFILNVSTPILMDYRLTQITPAIAVLIGFGLATIQSPSRLFLVAVIVVYGITIDDTPRPRPPWREVGQNAAQYAQPGDLALAHITPSGDWQVIYYYDRFMPDGVKRRSLRQWQLEDGDTYAAGLPALLEEHPHVWFMHWSQDRSGFDALAATGHTQTAVMTEDWLGNDLNVYRFDVVPPRSDALTAFENGMVLRDAAIVPDDLRVDLWWSADSSPDNDYTVSARLLDASGRLVAQMDSGPFNGERPTSTWGAGDVVYDPRVMTLAAGVDALSPGEYTVSVLVYRFDGAGITNVLTLDGAETVTVGTLTVE